MKLTKNSLNVLNNFMNINKNLMIREGNVIKTINEAKTVVAEATIDNEFPQDFGISDLRNFLNTLNIFNEPELEFHEDKIVIKEDNIEYDYYRASDAVLTDPHYGKNINTGEKVCEINITSDQLKNIVKAANTIKSTSSSNCSGVRFYKNKNDEIVVESKLYKNEPSKNVYRLIVETNPNVPNFDVIIDSSKLTVLEDDYKIILYKDRCMQMQGLNNPVLYTIAYEVV